MDALQTDVHTYLHACMHTHIQILTVVNHIENIHTDVGDHAYMCVQLICTYIDNCVNAYTTHRHIHTYVYTHTYEFDTGLERRIASLTTSAR